ncbi:hypothetical protein RIF25_08720 [Thermosynechococcaceae cyanobacterium BACA0444]|uniref:Uncharacterized protein n=1 Tax=Pseudocalidococcus azoricus BACA0444 TaxID=2918990 RepID=A0AAE4FRP1_9CYAN|nr:hypothetical protein [Pseudocalidococcus azoricus]MDS3860896.1 hypothetical protein [Pseudocalidococcus azoricus BACA0444]
MDLLSQQIAALSSKIDSLYVIVEQLNQKLSLAINEGKIKPSIVIAEIMPDCDETADWVGGTAQAFASPVHTSLEHKDILSDDEPHNFRSYSGERYMTNEVQIQRLTAQLTAAYNQIAALEERLLAHHSR